MSITGQATPESLTEVRRWLQAVDALTEAVNSTRSLRAILDLVASSARDLLDFDFCAVLLPDSARHNLVITGWSGLSADYVARVNADRPVRLTESDTEQAPSSKAFKTGRPVAVADIAAEPEFTPWGGVAREQGYRAMVSVPLVAGGTVVGTLNGYHEAVHDFTDHQLERLTLLANHAAIALSSARLVEQMTSMNDSLLRQRDLLAKSEQIHQQLLSVALHGGGMAGIVQALSALIIRPVLVEDARGTVLAQVGASEELQDNDTRRSVGSETPDDGGPIVVDGPLRSYLAWPVQLAGETVARVWVPASPGDVSPIDQRAVEHASIVISLEVVRLRTGIEVEHRLRGELLADLLAGGDVDSTAVRERAQRLGHDLSVPHVAMVGRVDAAGVLRQTTAEQRALNAVADRAVRQQPRPLVAMHRGLLVALWPVDVTVEATERQLLITRAADSVRRAMALQGSVTATVAVSGAGRQPLVRAYRTARGALEVALRSGRVDATVTLADLGVSGLLLQVDDPGQLLEFADQTLAGIRAHDRQRGTQLLQSLRTYLDNDQNRLETARALHVHPNTVSQRLQRVQALTGLDPATPAAAVQIRAALTVLDVAQGV